MISSGDLEWFELERLYDDGQELFLSGSHEQALDWFKGRLGWRTSRCRPPGALCGAP